MSTITAKKQQQQLAEALNKKTHFCKFDIECLLRYFRDLTKAKMDRNAFRDILHNCFHMTDDIIMDRVFRAFDRDNDSYISMEEWVKGLSVFLKGTKEEKMKFCFLVYDLNGDGHISKEEMFHLLKAAVAKQTGDEDPDEGVKELVDIVLRKLDQDHDNRVSFNDYKNAVGIEFLLLEAFGQCLPNEQDVSNFLCTLKSEYGHGNHSEGNPMWIGSFQGTSQS